MPRYFILTGIPYGSTRRELIFGDYDREVVADERQVERDRAADLDPVTDPDHAALCYAALRVHRLPDDRQITIDAFMRELNRSCPT